MDDSTIPGGVSAAVRRVATSMLGDVHGLAGRMADRLLHSVRDLGVDNVGELIREVCEANCTALLSGLMRATPVEYVTFSPEVSVDTRTIIRARVPFIAQVRGTHLGQALFIEEWMSAVTEHLAPDDRTDALLAGTRYTAIWADQVIQQISASYDESATWLNSVGLPVMVALVGRVLAGSQESARQLRDQHGYDVHGRHRASVLRCTADDTGDLLIRQVAAIRRAIPGPTLVTLVDEATVWLWSQIDSDHGAAEWKEVPDVHVGVGRETVGIDGFRASHQQALDTDRLALATGRRGTTAYDDVAIATLCVGDLADAQRFVAAELGDLAGADPWLETTRATVQCFFEHRCNFRSTARELNLHHNSVIYRIQQAERLLGRPIAERPVALQAALHLHRALQFS